MKTAGAFSWNFCIKYLENEKVPFLRLSAYSFMKSLKENF